MANKLRIIVDADDVLLSCNEYALELLEKEEGVRGDIQDITGWGLLNKEVDKRLKYFDEKSFFETQPALPGAVEFLDQLCARADVTIMTAVNPCFIGERIARIATLFPKFPLNHIMIGERKEMVQADIILDDRIHNIMSTGCKLPVLFRQPWNRKISGLCAVNNYQDFLTIVDYMSGTRQPEPKEPKIICLVGPGGSGKHEVAESLCQTHEAGDMGEKTSDRSCCFEMVHPLSTTMMDEKSFETMEADGLFLETTFYDNERYGTLKISFDAILSEGKNPVVIMDSSGCMSLRSAYPGQCKVFFLKKRKRDCILSILGKGLEDTQIADRITAIDYEEKNSILADHVLDMDRKGIDEIIKEIMSEI